MPGSDMMACRAGTLGASGTDTSGAGVMVPMFPLTVVAALPAASTSM